MSHSQSPRIAMPLRESRQAAIPLSSESPQPASTTTDPAPTSLATESAAVVTHTLPAPPVQLSSSSLSSPPPQEGPESELGPAAMAPPPAHLGFPPLDQPAYACGPEPCELCDKNGPPINHTTAIPDFIVSTIIRHAMPHRFETLKQIKKSEESSPSMLLSKQEVSKGDDGEVEYGPRGEFNPPAWTSDKARPKKSCLRKHDSVRFAPYPSTSTRRALARSNEDIKASLNEARNNRILLNYEGPNAIAIRNEISAIPIPGEEPFKWQPEYTGCPAEAFNDCDNPLDKATVNLGAPPNDLASSPEKDFKDEDAVVQLTLARPSKKRRYEEDYSGDETPVGSLPAVEGSPTKKPRTTKQPSATTNANFSKPMSKYQNPKLFSSPPPRSLVPLPPLSPNRSASPSDTLTTLPTDSSSSDEEPYSPTSPDSDSQCSSRKTQIAKKKLRFRFNNASSTHPKFGVPDSIYFHHHRSKSSSKKGRSDKKTHTYVSLTGDWTASELEEASFIKGEWDQRRGASFQRLTSRKSLDDQIKKNETVDKAAEKVQRLVDWYEAGWPSIDLAGVRARYIRPVEITVLRGQNSNKRALGPCDAMREHYPPREHPAWEGVDEKAIAEWEASSHYTLRVMDMVAIVLSKAKERRRANAEPGEATKVANAEDQEKGKVKRGDPTTEVEVPSVTQSGLQEAAPDRC